MKGICHEDDGGVGACAGEHGGMNEVMANLYAITGKQEYLALARRFDHKQIFGPLEAERDELQGKHVNTLVPKIIGAARLYELTGDAVPPVPVLVADSEDPASWVKRTGDKDLRFRTQNVGKPGDVSLVPLNELHHQRYTVYWKILTQAELLKGQAAREAEQQRLRELDARTVDLVTPDADLERAHNQQGDKSYAGAAFGRRWRDARGGGWFSYDMKVPPDQPVGLTVTYWGGDSAGRVFDILIDGQKIATQKLTASKPGEFVDVAYAVPLDLTKGKQKVTVKFQAHPGSIAGGAFGCRILRNDK